MTTCLSNHEVKCLNLGHFNLVPSEIWRQQSEFFPEFTSHALHLHTTYHQPWQPVWAIMGWNTMAWSLALNIETVRIRKTAHGLYLNTTYHQLNHEVKCLNLGHFNLVSREIWRQQSEFSPNLPHMPYIYTPPITNRDSLFEQSWVEILWLWSLALNLETVHVLSLKYLSTEPTSTPDGYVFLKLSLLSYTTLSVQIVGVGSKFA